MLPPPQFMTQPYQAPQPWAAPPQTAVAPQTPAWPPLLPQPPAAPREQPRPVVRMQMADPPAPAPTRLTLPPPEQLGVAGPRTTPAQGPAVDWNVTRDRLHRLGAVGFHLVSLPGGTCRVAFVLPTDQAGRVHQVEAEAATEALAVCQALDRADRWVAQPK